MANKRVIFKQVTIESRSKWELGDSLENTHLKGSSLRYYSSPWLWAAGSWHFLPNLSRSFSRQRNTLRQRTGEVPAAGSSQHLKLLKAGFTGRASATARIGIFKRVTQRQPCLSDDPYHRIHS